MSFPTTSFLLPQNRRLRHLRGLSLRNLVLPASMHAPGADNALAPKSTSALRHISRSDPQEVQSRGFPENEEYKYGHTSPSWQTNGQSHQRPRLSVTAPSNAIVARAVHRRITLSGSTALARQHILEQVITGSTANVFFSLHCDVLEEPFYVSEVEEQATNFSFRFFDLACVAPVVSRASQLTIRIWVSHKKHSAGVRKAAAAPTTSNWFMFIEDTIDLRLLDCIGNTPPFTARLSSRPSSLASTSSFPPNCVLYHLVDGVYLAERASTLTPPFESSARQTTKKTLTTALPTSSYGALMRLANLENSLRDSFAVQDKLAAQIDYLFRQQGCGNDKRPRISFWSTVRTVKSEGSRRVASGLSHQHHLVDVTRSKRDSLAVSLRARRSAIASGRALQKLAEADVGNAVENLDTARATDLQTRDRIHGQRRRICEDLMRIFALGPLTHAEQPLEFQICGLPLPNTELLRPASSAMSSLPSAAPLFSLPTSTSFSTLVSVPTIPVEECMSAALGYVALLVNSLQNYLGTALPYTITAYGSRSVIRDNTSKIPDQQRIFPLYLPQGGLGAQYRFDYGWFLLNKNIETLCHFQGLKVVDLRHTLPNLQYLLCVCSAGSDDLPSRKKGGVRGLCIGHIHHRSTLSTVSDSDVDNDRWIYTPRTV